MTKEEQFEVFEALPDQAYLKECFDYSPETGELKWRARPREHFLSCNRDADWEMKRRNSTLAGKPFGSKNTHGHIRGRLDGAYLYAHRLIWKIAHGVDPEIVDHINGDPSDNRLQNLRSGTRADNQRNQKRSIANTSGVVGVYSHKQSGGWYARINSPNGTKLTFYSKSMDLVVSWRREQEAAFGYSARA